MSKFFDATVAISPEIAVYEGDPKVTLNSICNIKKGDPYSLSFLSFSSHTGTHIDAPSHFFKNGKSLDEISIETLMGPVKVVMIRNCNSISIKSLEKFDLNGTERILIKTEHSFLRDRYTRFRSNYVHMEVDACGYLVQKGIKLFGIDSFSIDPYESKGYMCHKVLLGAGVTVLEMVDLKAISPGNYFLYCLPLKIYKGDGAPARVILQSM